MPEVRALAGVDFDAEQSDVAALLIQMSGPTKPRIDRHALRAEWRHAATDIDRPHHDRGSLATRRLKDGLSALERIGAVRRIGADAVLIVDRGLVQQVADLWDDD